MFNNVTMIKKMCISPRTGIVDDFVFDTILMNEYDQFKIICSLLDNDGVEAEYTQRLTNMGKIYFRVLVRNSSDRLKLHKTYDGVTVSHLGEDYSVDIIMCGEKHLEIIITHKG